MVSHFFGMPFVRGTIVALIGISGIIAVELPAAAANADGMRQHARICSPLTAVRKARAMGIRGPEIRDMTPRRVVVAGRGKRGADRIVFENVPGCPLLRR